MKGKKKSTNIEVTAKDKKNLNCAAMKRILLRILFKIKMALDKQKVKQPLVDL